MKAPNEMSATEALRAMAAGTLSAETLMTACLDRITASEPVICAWDSLRAEAALEEARACDRSPRRGLLHGLPIGIKDIIDTGDLPTRLGSKAFAHRQPAHDATAVRRLRQAGAIVVGKNVTTEFAYFTPNGTRNPHNPAHTPGGSSSGSAAAVADRMVPLSLGTQAAGSTIRPASFCGVIGFKPTHDRWDMSDCLRLYPSIDTLSIFSRCVSDAALIDLVMTGQEPAERAEGHRPRILLYYPIERDRAGPASQQALIEAVEVLTRAGVEVLERAPAPDLHCLLEASEAIVAREAWLNSADLRTRWDSLSEIFRSMLESGSAFPEARYHKLLGDAVKARHAWAGFMEGFDAALTFSVPGEAPEGIGSTGDPVFIRTFNVLGVPTMNLPLARGPKGLPVGVQLVGRRDGDRMLLATASRLMQMIGRSDLA
jgi:Asp-tRNA(Asn)/Glu-tRNA(Gln) amidotransferase A subunit family amidase